MDPIAVRGAGFDILDKLLAGRRLPVLFLAPRLFRKLVFFQSNPSFSLTSEKIDRDWIESGLTYGGFQDMDYKSHCEYEDICPYHHKGVGCVMKYFFEAFESCDFVKKQKAKERQE